MQMIFYIFREHSYTSCLKKKNGLWTQKFLQKKGFMEPYASQIKDQVLGRAV